MAWKDRPRWLRWTTEALVILGIILVIRTWQHQDIATGNMPTLSGMTVSQQTLILSAHPTQPTLIHFFAPWCPVCRVMHSNVAQAAEHYPVIMVAVQTEPEALATWLAEHPNDAPTAIINDAEGHWFQAFGGKALPLDVIIDSQGKIVSTEVGYTTSIGLWLRLWWASL